MEVGLPTERALRVQVVVLEYRHEHVRILLLRMEVLIVPEAAQDRATQEYSVPSTVCGVRGDRVRLHQDAVLDPRVVQELDLSSEEPIVLERRLARVIRELPALPVHHLLPVLSL